MSDLKLTIVAALSSLVPVAFVAMVPVAPSAAHSFARDRSLTLTEASVDGGSVHNSGASEVYASPVVVSVPSRTAARPVVATIAHAAQTFTSCTVRDLVHGSGSVQTCETVVVR